MHPGGRPLIDRLRAIADEEFYYGKKGYSEEGKVLRQAADENERLSCEGRKKDAVIEAFRCYHETKISMTPRDMVEKNIANNYRRILEALTDLDSVSEEQCQHLHKGTQVVCKSCGEIFD
jgi:hypothetical protein